MLWQRVSQNNDLNNDCKESIISQEEQHVARKCDRKYMYVAKEMNAGDS